MALLVYDCAFSQGTHAKSQTCAVILVEYMTKKINILKEFHLGSFEHELIDFPLFCNWLQIIYCDYLDKNLGKHNGNESVTLTSYIFKLESQI